MNKERWVVVANSAQARLFKLKNLDLIEMDALIHAESRLHEKELRSDKPGMTNEGVSSGKFAMGQQKSPKRTEAEVFAKEVADHLELARSRGEIDRIYLAAAPSFLGRLRGEMTDLTSNLIEAEVDKDITHLKPKEIITYFPIGL